MLYQPASVDCTFIDYFQVIIHGLTLDASMSGILIIIPFLLAFVSVWINKLKIRTILLPYLVLAALLISISFIVDMSLYDFWNFKLDGTVLIYLDSPENVTANVSTIFIAFRIFFILLWAMLVFLILRKITPKMFGKLSIKAKITGSFIMIFMGGVIFLFIRGGVTDSTANIGKAYFSNNQFLNHSAVNPMFSFFYSLDKSEDFSKQFDYFEEDERKKLFEGLYVKGGTTQKQLLDTIRPDILIVLLESFSGSITEAIGGNPSITPNFNRLVHEGVFFSNLWSNSFRTDRGVVCALSGHPALPTTSIMKMPVKSKSLPSIASSLSKAGYLNEWFYGGDINFTNMQSYLRSTGYQKITSRTDFSLKDQSTNAWGVTDHIMFDHVFNVINRKNDSPWHVGFLTLSSHDPFEVPFNRFEEKIPNAFAYTDSCFGVFIDNLKKSPAWDNLLIICLADHGCTYPKYLTFATPDYYHTPMLWLGGAVKKPETIDILMNQTDMAATLLAQLKLPYNDFLFSRDVFSDNYSYPFSFFSYPSGFGLKDSTGISVYDINPDKVIFEEPLPNEERVLRSKAILQTLYDDLGAR